VSELKVRFISNFPLSVMYGGFEVRCVQTCRALKSIGVNAELLDWHDEEQSDFILHLYGHDIMWARLIECWGKRAPVVITAIAGNTGFRKKMYLKDKVFDYCGRMFRRKTIFSQIQQMLHQVDKVICHNEREQDFFVNNYELHVNKTAIISNGVYESRYTATGDAFTEKYGVRDFVLFVGNITQRKNPLLLAQCLNEAGLNGVFIGKSLNVEKVYGYEFENIISKSQNLIWIPGLDYYDQLLSSAFAAARVFCLPSVSETRPLSALEAMAAGKPLIMGDLPYACQSPFENAVKVNPTDKEKLISAIKATMKIKLSDISKLSDKHSWKSVAEKMEQLYRDLWDYSE